MSGAVMIDEVAAAITRVLGHPVSLREDTPLETFGQWSSIAVLVGHALHESTGRVLTDAQLAGARTAGDLAMALGPAR